MRIIITGVNGFVGKTLYKVLSSKHTVIGLGHNNKTISDTYYNIDIMNKEAVQTFIDKSKNNQVDCIIHLASRTAKADSLSDISILNDNAKITYHTALMAKAFRVKHFIHLSSSSIYPNTDGSYGEDSLPDPSVNNDCVYGLSKYNQEILLNYFLKNSETIVTHLRCSMIYGKGMNATRLIPVLQNEIAEKGTATLYGNGERLLNIIHVEKLIEYILFFLENPIQDIVNVSEECVSTLELAKRLIAEQANEAEIILKNEGNQSKFKMDITKLHKLTQK